MTQQQDQVAPENATSRRNIFQRVNEVRKKVAYLQKKKNVESYKAVTHDQVTGELRDHLIEFGIVIAPPSVVSSRVVETGTFTAKKVPFIRYEATYEIDLINMDDPRDHYTVKIEAHAIDHGDKAPGKAMSYAWKAAMLKLFNIETGEEEEERPEAHGAALTQKEYADWETAIDALTETGEPAQALWKKITAACEKVNDVAAATKLKARLTAKLTALKKLNGKAKDANPVTH